MNGNGRYPAEMPDVAGSVSGLTHDMVELGELQTQLLGLELKNSVRKTRTCLILAVIAACLLLASIPVALLALAELLVEQLDWTRSAAFGVATLAGLLLSAIFAGAAYAIVRRGLVSLPRSREEFGRNVAWIKSTLRGRAQYGGVRKA